MVTEVTDKNSVESLKMERGPSNWLKLSCFRPPDVAQMVGGLWTGKSLRNLNSGSLITLVVGEKGVKVRANPSNLLESLSNNDVTFFIPPYQRNYEWSESTCKVFLQDVIRVAESNVSGTYAEHFFGSIVYVVEEAGFGIPDKYILTDGQQRITTTMLFLMALRDSLSEEEYRNYIQKRFLENERAKDDSEFKIKLKQVETDWEAYRLLALRLDVPEKLRNSTVFQNYSFFKRELKKFAEPQVKELLENGLNKFSIISIQLEPDRNPWENPQEIFESMNSLGKPLSLADLVRNYLLMGIVTSRQTSLYDKYWLALEKRLPGRLSEFIRDWMQATQHKSFKVAKESNFKELYGQFKELSDGRDVEGILESLVEFSVPYSVAAGIESSGIKGVDRILSDLQLIGMGPAHSYLSELIWAWHRGEFSASQLLEIMEALRTYLLRRRILGVSTAENKFFPVLGARIRELHSARDLAFEVFTQLSSQEYALRLPNDDEVGTRLETMNFYNFGPSRTYPRLLLSLIEENLTKARPSWDDSDLQLEHIMPQSIGTVWMDMLGEEAEDIHRQLVHSIGNLTLIRHNQELGNKNFNDKKVIYAGKSGLQLSQNWILDQPSWDADAIRNRASKLVSILINQVLKVPSPLKHSSNWRQVKDTDSQFDSKEIMNQLIGQEIQYTGNPRITAIVVSDSKVMFEGKEWSLGPLTKELKLRDGKVSDLSQFHGAYYWTWDNVRLIDLEL